VFHRWLITFFLKFELDFSDDKNIVFVNTICYIIAAIIFWFEKGGYYDRQNEGGVSL
jgi:hypothetical protein